MGDCNVGDILCELEVLQSMKALRKAIGEETFQKEFPELEGLDTKLVAKIGTSKESLREALAQCGNLDLEEVVGESEAPIEFEEY